MINIAKVPFLKAGAMSLQTKLHLSFGFLCVLVLVTGAFGLVFVNRISNAVDRFSNVSSPLVDQASNLTSKTREIHARLLEASKLDSAVEVQAIAQEFQTYRIDAEATTAAIGQRLERGGLKDIDLQTMKESFDGLTELASAFLRVHHGAIVQEAIRTEQLANFDQLNEALVEQASVFLLETQTTVDEFGDAGRTLIQNGGYSSKEIETLLDATFNRAYPLVVAMSRVQSDLRQLEARSRDYVAEADPDKLAALESAFNTTIDRIMQQLEGARDRASSDGARQTIAGIADRLSALHIETASENGLFAAHRELLDKRLHTEQLAAALDATLSDYQSHLERILESARRINGEVRETTDQSVQAALTSITFIAIGGVVIGLLAGFVQASGISRPVRMLTKVFAEVAEGQHDVTIPSQRRRDEIGALARTLSSFLETSVSAAQSQSALSVASANFMIVGPDARILSMNRSAYAMFTAAEEDLREARPGFSVEGLVGRDLSELAGSEAVASPATDGATVGDADTAEPVVSDGGAFGAADIASNQARQVQVEIGRRIFDLTITPVISRVGSRLGLAVEWKDMTEQLEVEREVAGIVHAAGEGNFSERLSEADKSGFMADLARGINELLEVVDSGLEQVIKVVSALAEGDLTKRMEGEHRGAFRQLKEDVDRMGDQMEQVLGRIAEVASSVQGATSEMASGIDDLSSRTEHQASSLEETAASMEEMAATVRQNADHAQEASEVATAARDTASEGGALVERAVAETARIEEASGKITEIVGMIQEIAFQTNLLALNASVEAARAGEAGKGFSVVANEVRALAQRAAQASKDIKELIVASDNQVQEGTKLVKEAGAVLGEIVTSVKTVAEHVSEIAVASKEQTVGIEQVSAAISGMDGMTQQNAALVEETNGAIRSASDQVDQLRETVAFFKIAQQKSAVRPADPSDRPAPNPVRAQRTKLAGTPASGRSAASAGVAPATDGWEEF